MILVTGGTGLVGSHLLYFLAASGANLRATHRKTSDLSRVENIFGYYTDKKTARDVKKQKNGSKLQFLGKEDNLSRFHFHFCEFFLLWAIFLAFQLK